MFCKVLPLLLWFMPIGVMGQFSDDFSDGNFLSNPEWTGNNQKFSVDNEMLRLNDNQAGNAFLATQSYSIHNTQWEFWVRLAFTPSTNNHPRIYLVSDNQDLQGLVNGYFIRIGKDGSSNKRLFFCRQDGQTITEIMAGADNIATGTNNMLRVKVIRDKDGNWEFWVDPAGGKFFLPQGSATDNTYTTTSWFGIHCFYTISNSTRFYFDDFYVGEPIQDNDPLLVSRVKVVSAANLEVHFNKAVEPVSAQKVINYYVNHGIGSPMIASQNPATPNIVDLLFAENFACNFNYELHIMNVKDYQGNTMTPCMSDFVLYQASRFDVVFNELMVDPTPAVGLAPYEYIELFNTTSFPINIEGWVLQHATTLRALPFARILPGDYLLLTTQDAYPHLKDYGNVVGVPGLSSTALTNEGNSLLLYDGNGVLISFVSYSDQWYQNPAKAQGGWALEKIDPFNFCQGSLNWRCSEDSRGGTPAVANSVMGSNPDTVQPHLLRAGYSDAKNITLFFSQPMDEFSLLSEANYQLNPYDHTTSPLAWNPVPVHVKPLLPDFSTVELTFEHPMEEDVIYEIQAGSLIQNCPGIGLGRNKAMVAVPAVADSLEMVINEVLFNPAPGGVRYLELYNRSGKVIDLKEYTLCTKDTIGNFLYSIREISQGSYLFFPGTYLVLSSNPQMVKQHYMTPNPGGFITTQSLPGMTNTRGIIALAAKNLQLIDMLIYHEDMHLPLLSGKSGVALERVNPDRPTLEASNWHSAAQNAGFGTPGYQNSQYTLNMEPQDDSIQIYPKVFSPDGDGHDDLLNISYGFEQAGWVANIRIFDSRGRLICFLRHGELLAAKGVISWNGITDQAQKAPIGIYIIHLEVYNATGDVRSYRKTAVLGGKL